MRTWHQKCNSGREGVRYYDANITGYSKSSSSWHGLRRALYVFFRRALACLGFVSLEGWEIPWLLIIAVLVSVALFVGGFSLRRAAGQLTDQVTAENAQYWKRAGRWFTIAFATQGIAIGVTSAICGATGHYELILPLTALIVGVHFLPLAPLFRVKSYYITGTLLCVLSVITLLTVPSKVTLHGQQILLW